MFGCLSPTVLLSEPMSKHHVLKYIRSLYELTDGGSKTKITSLHVQTATTGRTSAEHDLSIRLCGTFQHQSLDPKKQQIISTACTALS